jgi:hypothetical protein
MCRKSFTIATFVRHSISKLPENYYLLPSGIIKCQIAIGKGFSAHMPVINRSVRVYGFLARTYAEKTIFSTPSPKFQPLIISSLFSLSLTVISVNPALSSISFSSFTGTAPVIQPL